MKDNLITIAIRSFEQANVLSALLEKAGIKTSLLDVDDKHSRVSEGVRVRIDERDLPKALQIIENPQMLDITAEKKGSATKKILVPIDFSDYSLRTCEVAFRIADSYENCEIVLLHAYFIPKSFYKIDGKRAIRHDKDELRHFKARLTADLKNIENQINTKISENILPNIKFSIISVEGVPEDSILEYCEREKPHMVVMGTRGKDKKEEELIGSVTAEVIEHALVPVLAIPENANVQRISGSNVLFATNFDSRMLVSFQNMMEMFKAHKFNLLIAHFECKHDEWNRIKMNGLKEFCAENYKNVTTDCMLVPTSDDILSTIDKLVAERQINLIVLNTHKRNLLARMFNPSMARKMVFHANTPILAFHS